MRTGSVLDAIKWFRKKHYSKNGAFALRQYKTDSIIKGEQRFKVIDIYPQKVDGLYFIVYKKTPVKEKQSTKAYACIYGSIFEEYRVCITHSAGKY